MRKTGADGELDGGWAWVVLAAAFCIHGLLVSVAKSFGLFFVQIMLELDATASQGTLLFGVFNALCFFTGPFTAALSDVFSCRAVVFAGALLLTTGFLLASVSTTMFSLTLSFGLVGGLGFGMTLLPGPLMVSRYFKRHRALANGILFTSAGVGGIAGPPVVTALLAAFGLQQTFVFVAGGFLHVLVAAALYRPFHQTRAVTHSTDLQHPLTDEQATENVPVVEKKLDDQDTEAPKRKLLPVSQSFESEAESLDSIYSTKKVGTVSLLDLPAECAEPWDAAEPNEERLNRVWHRLCHVKARDGRRVPLIDVKVLSNKAVVLFIVAMMTGIAGICISLITPAHTKEAIGLTNKQVSVLLMIGGISETVGRLVTAFSGDRAWCKQRLPTITAVFTAIMGASTVVSGFAARSFATQALYLTVFHLSIGGFVALHITILADLVGAARMSSAFGLVVFVEGIGTTSIPVIVGLLRDRTGNYVAAYVFVALCYLVTTVCFVSLPPAAPDR